MLDPVIGKCSGSAMPIWFLSAPFGSIHIVLDTEVDVRS